MSYLLGDVTPTEDPLTTCDDLTWEKLCPGILTVPATDTSFLSDLTRVDQIKENGGVGIQQTGNVKNWDRKHSCGASSPHSRDVTPRPSTRTDDDHETLVIPDYNNSSHSKPDRLDLFWEEVWFRVVTHPIRFLLWRDTLAFRFLYSMANFNGK